LRLAAAWLLGASVACAAEAPAAPAPPATGIEQPPSAQQRLELAVAATDTVRYRRVRLRCGSLVLSEADNWYVPSRLTPEMNRTLASSDIPFGTVVAPLKFRRKTLAAAAVRQGTTIFRVKAVLLNPENRPFSLVMENYQRDLLGR